MKINFTEKVEFLPANNEDTIMLHNNCEYRNVVYNILVDVVWKLQENHPQGHISFKTSDLIRAFRSGYELNDAPHRPDDLEKYDYYFRGISECVVDDIAMICNRIKTERKKGKPSNINKMEFNPNNHSFRYKNKLNRVQKRNADGFYSGSRVEFDYKNGYSVKLRINNTYEKPMEILLREDVLALQKKHGWTQDDIKEIAIKYHNDRWYICFIISADVPLKIYPKRKKVAGIDIGEARAVVLYDGQFVPVPESLAFPKAKVNMLNRRLSNLQNVLDKKEKGSNNYKKVLTKMHKIHEHLKGIRKDWHFKLAHWIVTHYKRIVVDEFKNHIVRVNSDCIAPVRKKCNFSMLNKGMSIFMQRLRHMCIKYNTKYYVSLGDTTNVCSTCGHKNTKILQIKKGRRDSKFICENNPKHIFDRDDNAAINCYNSYFTSFCTKIDLSQTISVNELVKLIEL